MIPILYSAEETAFLTNGIGRLPECLRCEVTEERNGTYECEFDLPITAKHYPDISEGMIISVIHDDSKTRQPFVIYRRTAPIDGVVTFYAHHISYRLSGVVVAPFEAETVAEAFLSIPTYSLNTNQFTFWTNKSSRGTFGFKYPVGCRQMLGGVKGSILDAFGGGEYEFDKFEVKLRQSRGSHTGVRIRYGKNLADIKKDYDISNTFGGVVGYWQGGQDNTVVRTGIIYAQGFSDGSAVGVVDFSSEFNEEPTVAQLNDKVAQYIQTEKPYEPDLNITVDFVALWQTPEYEQYAVLQRVALCDYVYVAYPALGIDEVEAEVIRVKYDVLGERYLEIELGKVKTSFADVILSATQIEIEQSKDTGLTARIQQQIDDAIAEATAAITGGAGGNFVIVYDADEKPIEVCFLDTGDISTAVNVWRWNGAGLAHSSHGYNGPYDDFAILANGAINASRITTGSLTANLITAGTMLADRILGGTLKLGGSTVMGNGVLQLYNSNDVKIGQFDQNGIDFISPATYTSNTKRGADFTDGAWRFYNLNTSSNTKTQTGYIESIDGNRLEIGQNFSTAGSGGGINFKVKSGSNTANMSLSVNSNGVGTFVCPETTSLGTNGMTVRYNKRIYADTDYLYIGINTSDVPTSSTWLGGVKIRQSGMSNPLGVYIEGCDLYVQGTHYKSKVAETENYGKRLLSCYETPVPMYGDSGSAQLDEDGSCIVEIDDILQESTELDIDYQVFLQKEGRGDLWVAGKTPRYFMVEGDPGLRFSWELKARQKGFRVDRFEPLPDNDIEIPDPEEALTDELNSIIAEQEAIYETA